MDKDTTNLISKDDVEDRIHMIRGKQVMLDRDLAELYGVETKRLNEQGVAMLSGVLRSPTAIRKSLSPFHFLKNS